jgi:HSP20 family molecular chaperone IbpA
MEIRSGKFTNAVTLPGPVDSDRALAEYQDGFLTITLPKETTTQG